MSSSILINSEREETRVALLDGGQLVEFYVERTRDASLVGNIYKGKVVKILPGMQSAFVDIGLEKAAFLYVADIRVDLFDDYSDIFEEENTSAICLDEKHARSEAQIEDLIQEGQELLVQVSKDPLGTKGARVTSYITLPGRYLVLMPGLDHIGISRRILDEDERERLRATVESIKPRGSGLIVRTVSTDASTEELKRDLEFLTLLWENCLDKKDRASAPLLVYTDLDLAFRSVRDLMRRDVDSLIIDSHAEFNRIKEFVNTYFSKLSAKIEFYDGTEPIFEYYGVEMDITKSLEKVVWLKSGGYIILEQTEAMTVIDVNTGRYVGKETLEDTILKTNLEAVKEIAYQIRLRNLGGIIIIDFIDMEILENRDKLFTAFSEALKQDRVKITLSQITELGLIQMTRKRVRESIGRTLCETCPYCEGKGFVKSPRTICYEIFRKLRRMAHSGKRKIIITAHPKISELLSDEEWMGVVEIEEQYNIKIIVTENPKFHQENYELAAL